MKRSSSQNGNVLFLILIAVILFAVLSYAVTRSSRGGGPSADADKKNLDVSATLQYLTGIRAAIQRMMINGCDETQISFEMPATGTYYHNPNSPTDKHCNVFDPAGGGISFRQIGSLVFDVVPVSIDGIGTSKTDLVFFGFDMGSAFCDQLTTKMYGTTTNAGDVMGTVTHFIGDYTDPQPVQLGDSSDTYFKGKPAGCFSATNTSKGTHLYFALLER